MRGRISKERKYQRQD